MATHSFDRLKNSFGQLVLEAFITLSFVFIVFWVVMLVGASGLSHYQDKYFFKKSKNSMDSPQKSPLHKIISNF